MHLDKSPLCVLCARIGRDTPATVVDHIRPHEENAELFWDESNWQSLCSSCHSGLKRKQERHGYTQAADLNGVPIDEGHPWNKHSG